MEGADDPPTASAHSGSWRISSGRHRINPERRTSDFASARLRIPGSPGRPSETGAADQPGEDGPVRADGGSTTRHNRTGSRTTEPATGPPRYLLRPCAAEAPPTELVRYALRAKSVSASLRPMRARHSTRSSIGPHERRFTRGGHPLRRGVRGRPRQARATAQGRVGVAGRWSARACLGLGPRMGRTASAELQQPQGARPRGAGAARVWMKAEGGESSPHPS